MQDLAEGRREKTSIFRKEAARLKIGQFSQNVWNTPRQSVKNGQGVCERERAIG